MGLPKDFTICDRNDQSGVVRDVLSSLGPEGAAVTKDLVLDFVSAVKNRVRSANSSSST